MDGNVFGLSLFELYDEGLHMTPFDIRRQALVRIEVLFAVVIA